MRALSATSSGRRAFLRASSTEAAILGTGMCFVVTAKQTKVVPKVFQEGKCCLEGLINLACRL